MNPPPVAVDSTVPSLGNPAATAAPARTPDELVVLEPVSSSSRVARRALRALSALGWALLGIAVFVALWYVATRSTKNIPTPADTFDQLREELGRAFRVDEMKGRGVGLEMQSSLWRVIKGFGFAAIVGVPLGLFMGGSKRAWQAMNPIVQILRPVSPLAWFPIWLRVHQDPAKAAVFVIFITALWPIVVNTAAGAASVPLDHRNVARVFKFGRIAYVRHVLIPDSMPNIVTGLRLSMGVAWMVIVAVEMLSGNSGIGNFTWESYNAGNLAGVAAAIVLIGVVGLVLDLMFLRLARLVRRAD
jgi:nitrate/nitrite transport system permease protein